MSPVGRRARANDPQQPAPGNDGPLLLMRNKKSSAESEILENNRAAREKA
jgi:hypothetical protein